MKIIRKNFISNNAKPEVIALVVNSMDDNEYHIQLNCRNGAVPNEKFVKYVKVHANQMKYASKHSPFQLFQNKKEEWKTWLLSHLDESWTQSPYSNSFYNVKNVTWNSKPEGSLRLSDHWNFYSVHDSKIHCQTTDPDFKDQWAVGMFKNGKYEIIKVFN